MPEQASQSQPDRGVALTKAVLRASERLGLSQSELATIVGLSEASVSRMANRTYVLSPKTKAGELALLLLRICRNLDAVLGGEQPKLVAWLNAPNTHLNGLPSKLLRNPAGLVHVADYLDTTRGKL